jgi:hypothetical protein
MDNERRISVLDRPDCLIMAEINRQRRI